MGTIRVVLRILRPKLPLLAAAAGLILLAPAANGANVGYYDMNFGRGNSTQVPAIVAAGETPVLLNDLSASDLVGIDVLLVQNPSNFSYGSEYLARRPDIQAAVDAGMVLIIHDRYVTAAASVLPGGGAITFIRQTSGPAAENIDVRDDTTLVTNGPGGVIDDASLDGGTSSNHGYAVENSLPADAALILTRPAPSDLVTFCYSFGSGSVIYSTIPLDFYLAGSGPNPPRQNFADIYAPNVVAYGAAGACNQGLTVEPREILISLGLLGGPFDPPSQDYTLQNDTSDPLDYEVTKSQGWISLDDGQGSQEGPLAGTLASEAMTTVTALIDQDAEQLGIGDYSEELEFTNLTDGQGDTTRTIYLRVLDPDAAQVVFNGDFELGNFIGWQQSDTGAGRFVLNDGTLDPPGPDGPQPPCAGSFGALSTQTVVGGQHELIYETTLLPGYDIVTLSWVDKIRNHGFEWRDPTQEFRVELRSAEDQVLSVVYSTTPGDPLLSGCTSRSFDISQFAEQTIRIAFVEQDSIGFLNVHVDDVRLVLEQSNIPPTADAGGDQQIECTSPAGAELTLDGSGSSDPDSTPGTNDDIVLFEWFEDFGQPTQTLLGTGEVLMVALSLGSHGVTLRVTDNAGAQDTDQAEVLVADTTPPTLSVSLSPTTMWPPNHRMMWTDATVASDDVCSTPAVVLESVTSDEPDNATGNGDGNTVNDIQDAELQTADFRFRLRAERAGGGNGRVYTAVYSSIDASGNVATDEDHSFVPHDKHGVTEPVLSETSQKFTGTTLEWTAADGALYYNVVRGDLESIAELGNEIDLGHVVCIEAGSLDTNTIGWEDLEEPAPGQGFFYVVEYFDGWHSSYGTASASKPRVTPTGGCEE